MEYKHHLPHWHRGIHALHFGFLSGLMAVTLLGTSVLTVFSPLWIKQADAAVSNFSASSFWNTTIPSYTSLHPDSDALVTDISRQVGQFGTSFNKNTSSPVYVAEPGANTVDVIPWDCGSGIPAGLAAQWQGVPIPFFAVPGGGANNQMIVYQPSSSTVWEFGHMRNISGQWQACTGGRISSSTDGVFPSPYGISASGMATLAGQLNLKEVQTADINHAIGLTLPQVNGLVWPASQTSGATAGAPPMGMRFRLDPSINVDNLGLNATATAVARAAQTYGFVIWNTGGSVGVTAENPISLTSRGLPDPIASVGSGVLSGFPWDKLQAMPQDYGQSADVPAITKFTVSPSAVRADSKVTLYWEATHVNRCAISGVGDNFAASGSTVSPQLRSNTTFVIRCGGPAGTASSQVSVQVTPIGSNDPLPTLEPAVLIDQPYNGYANIIAELMSDDIAKQVYKVVYYEQETYLFETAKPPFALNTSRIDNGKHTIDAQIYYRDGRSERRSVGISVNNSPETLFAITQSNLIKAPPSIPRPWAIASMVVIITVMAVGSWWGYHRAHLMN